MGIDSGSHGSASRLLGALVIGVIVLAGTGLFAIQYHHQRAADAMARLLETGGLLDLARTAQVDFKLQVQEWKNLLLRSRSAPALEDLTAKFTAQEEVVRRQLTALAAAPALSSAMRSEVQDIQEEHQRLGGVYRQALQGYVPGDAQTIFTTDETVRGIDRNLNQRIDALAHTILESSHTQARVLRERGEDEYDTLRTVVSGVAGVVIVLTAILAWLVVRGGGLRQARPA